MIPLISSINLVLNIVMASHCQVIVFGSLYAKSFWKKAPQKTTSSVAPVQNENSNDLKDNP